MHWLAAGSLLAECSLRGQARRCLTCRDAGQHRPIPAALTLCPEGKTRSAASPSMVKVGYGDPVSLCRSPPNVGAGTPQLKLHRRARWRSNLDLSQLPNQRASRISAAVTTKRRQEITRPSSRVNRAALQRVNDKDSRHFALLSRQLLDGAVGVGHPLAGAPRLVIGGRMATRWPCTNLAQAAHLFMLDGSACRG